MAATAEGVRRRSPRGEGEDGRAAPNVAVEDARSRKEYKSDPLYVMFTLRKP